MTTAASAANLPAPEGDDRSGDLSRSQDSQYLVERLTQSVSRRSPQFERAWTKLKSRYRARLLRYAERQMGTILRAKFEAEDVVNEAWGRAFKDLDHFTYQGPLSFFHWLKRQVMRVVLDIARKEGRRGAVRREGDMTNSSSKLDPAADTAGPSSRAAYGEMRAVLEETLAELPELYRDVLREFYLLELPREEIARRHGRLPNTVTHQLKRGVRYWKEAIEKRFGKGSFDTWFGQH